MIFVKTYLPQGDARPLPRQDLQVLPDELLQAPPESDAAHRVQQEVYAEVCVIQQHHKLLNAPQQHRWLLPPQGEEEEKVQTNAVTKTKRKL